MKKIFALFLFVVSFLTIRAQTPYDTVNVRDPQNFVEMTSVDTAYFQLIGRKANLNRRMSLTTLKNWILAGVSGIDTVYLSGDTLNILQGLTLWSVPLTPAADGNGLFSAANNNDTIRVSAALLRAAFQITGGAYGMAVTRASAGYGLTVTNSSTGGGVYGSASSGIGLGGVATSGTAVSASASTGTAVYGASTSTGIAGWFLASDANNSAVKDVLRLQKIMSSGGALTGMGLNIDFRLVDSLGLTRSMGGITYKWSNASALSSRLDLKTMNTGTLATKLSLASTGQLALSGYANNALNNVDSSLYVLAVDASGDVHSVPKDSLRGGVSDNIYTADGTLTGDRTIDSDGYLLLNNGGFFAIADSTWYAAQGIIGEIPSGVVYGISNIGLTFPYRLFPGVNAISSQSEYSTATSYYDETFYAALVAKDGADSSQVLVGDADIRLYADTLDATGITTFLGFPSGGSQTLSTSNDSLTISGGNTVKLPITELLRDSVTTTTMTIDLETRYQKVVQIDMATATNLTLTINNPTDAGVYTFHFIGTSGTDNVTWPAAFLDAAGTALGTDALTTGTMYTCYYSSTDAKYYCK